MADIAFIPLATVCYLWAFWGLYVMIMGLYRAYLNNRLNTICKVLGSPFIVAGVTIDIFANVVIATALFVELPKEFLVTQRLRRYIIHNIDWRYSVARFVCDKLLDVFDPTGSHCS